jgi:putative phage-type endonuclease
MTTTTTTPRIYPGTKAVALASTASMSREGWLAHRLDGIGGSDIGAILGLNPWRSALDVWMEKRQITPEREANEAMEWGTILEGTIADTWAARNGKKVQRVNAILAHATDPILRANIDRLIVDPVRGNGILEVKNVGDWSGRAWEDDRVPDHYMMQLQWYLHVTGLTWGVFAALVGGKRLIEREVAYDAELADMAVERAHEFWQCVTDGTMPEVTGGDADALGTLYPESTGEEVVLSIDTSNIVREYVDCKQAIALLEESLEGMKAQIQAELGAAERGRADGYTVVWKSQTRATIDSKRLRAERPDVADAYTKESTTRTFSVKAAK